MPPSSVVDDQRTCAYCKVSKTLDQFRVLSGGVTSRCIACLDKLRASRQVTATAQCQATIQTLPTLNDFYLDLEVAKNQEARVHTIGNSMRTVRIDTLGDSNLFHLNPQTKEGSNAFQAVAEGITRRCREIFGYRWRYVMS